MRPEEVMELIVKTLDGKKARDIAVLKTGKITIIADYFIICTASSTTHIKTLSDETGKVLSEAGEPPLRVEGYRAGGWVLMDFGCAVAHLFLEETRKFYDLERLWGDAEKVDVSNLISD